MIAIIRWFFRICSSRWLNRHRRIAENLYSTSANPTSVRWSLCQKSTTLFNPCLRETRPYPLFRWYLWQAIFVHKLQASQGAALFRRNLRKACKSAILRWNLRQEIQWHTVNQNPRHAFYACIWGYIWTKMISSCFSVEHDKLSWFSWFFRYH